jgi:hypothetical protein
MRPFVLLPNPARIRPLFAFLKGRQEAVLASALAFDAMQAGGCGMTVRGAGPGGMCAAGESFCRVQCGISG